MHEILTEGVEVLLSAGAESDRSTRWGNRRGQSKAGTFNVHIH